MTGNSNYKPGVGRLVVDRYDFQKHIEGTDFKHKAIGIDLASPLSALGGATNVQTAFTNLNTYIDLQSGAGQGLVTVGDGYDTWHDADGNTNFDNTIPPLNVVLIPVFDAIINNTTVPASFVRIERGGIVVIKSGTYIITDTIEVPAGITIMGEGWGTRLVNATSLDLTTSPPNIDTGGTPKPIFRIKVDTNRTTNDAAVDSSLFMFSRQTRICNLVICDNFVENTILGDVFYKLPQNKDGDTPLISQESGSHLVLDNVMLLGRVSFSGGKVVSAATRFAVQLDVTTSITTGTILQINNSFIDGFSQPISFMSIGGSNDFLEITNSKIRTHGYLDGYGGSSDQAYNNIASVNGCNVRMVDNHFYGNHVNAGTVLYVNDLITGSVNTESFSKILVAANNIVIDKESVGDPVLYVLYVNPANLAEFYTKASAQTYGNHYQPEWGFEIDSALRVRVAETSGATYTIDAAGGDFLVLVDTSSSAVTINLPPHIRGRKIIIKDAKANSQNNNITLVRSGSTGNIENYAGDRILATNGAAWTLVSDGINWHIV